ncbi:proline dehydrogenase family protein [Deinococcus planocerae]|uniref:proline dehydrogenase family protein n=1 Tax=Deinococcus planocerae TaxID=1737569 RepID=UPI000C7F109B|nr:proline dehydrogenase family protein [Deinococcus planocerae]
MTATDTPVFRPDFPTEWQPIVHQVSDTLRSLALREDVKAYLEQDPVLLAIFQRVSRRYVAGETREEALARIAEINARSHAATVDYMGESCRDAGKARTETQAILELAAALGERGLESSLSLDISHVGSLVDEDLCYENMCHIARAAQNIGQEVMISMEGSDRTDATLEMYNRLHKRLNEQFGNVGITIQARMLRTERDLSRLLERPGRIRLVKGAYHESPSVAYPFESTETGDAYRRYARQLIASGHPCSIATSDPGIHTDLQAFIEAEHHREQPFEFEILMGLGSERLDSLRSRGYRTREYVVFGSEWFLYVCNRIADQPIRVLQAVVDAIGIDLGGRRQ